MSLNRSFANQFAATINTTSTGAAGGGSTALLQSVAALDFGFPSSLIKMVIDGGGPAYVQLNGSTAAAASDYKLTSGDTLTDWYDLGVGVSGLAIAATSTALSMRVGAWG